MREIGLTVVPQLIVEGDHTMEGGMKALIKLAAFRPRPTAILCSNDMTAIGVMREAYDYGLSIPEELSVVGFDDIRLSEFMIPPLTTIRMSQTEIARLAFRALKNEVGREAPAAEGHGIYTGHEPVLRKSTALAPGNSQGASSTREI